MILTVDLLSTQKINAELIVTDDGSETNYFDKLEEYLILSSIQLPPVL